MTTREQVEKIRQQHNSARPKHSNPAWLHTHQDVGALLEFIDSIIADAERYRWLRDCAEGCFMDQCTDPDAEIDTARATPNKTKDAKS